jgi:hypothetical protein
MPSKRFSPREANRTLPLVRRIVADILARGRELRQLSEGGIAPQSKARGAHLEAELNGLFEELAAIGCTYKDLGFERGLVDFPARIGGRDVLLCWKSDEPHVTWYHSPTDGFAGRLPIPRELLEAEPAAARERGD